MIQQWHDISTDLTECYETLNPVARGVVSRPRNQVSDYSAYIEQGGRSHWARQRFGDVQGAKAWCEDAIDSLARKYKFGDARILEVLRALGAGDVVARAEGLDAERDWNDLLSLGEQQVLAFARVLLAAPRFALLDRPAMLVGADAAVRALDLFARRSITVVTFAPDRTLAAQHDAELELAEGGTWAWQPRPAESRAHTAPGPIRPSER